jgi:hypothetical protein
MLRHTAASDSYPSHGSAITAVILEIDQMANILWLGAHRWNDGGDDGGSGDGLRRSSGGLLGQRFGVRSEVFDGGHVGVLGDEFRFPVWWLRANGGRRTTKNSGEAPVTNSGRICALLKGKNCQRDEVL